MKKIYYFLQNHKALKVIFYIFIVFNVLWYFILNIVLIVGLSTQPIEDHNAKLNIVATTPIKAMNKTSEYGIINPTEISNNDSFADLKACFTNDSYDENWMTTNRWMTPYWCYATVINNYNTDTLISDELNFKYRYFSSSNVEEIYVMSYKWVSNNNWQIYGCCYTRYKASNIIKSLPIKFTLNNASIFNMSLDDFNKTNFDGSWSWNVPRVDSVGSVNLFYNYIINKASITESINQAYNEGYTAATQLNYDNAYTQGYDEGYIAGAQGIETNAFSAIGQAFAAVTNIFGIEILPGLQLWVLVFAPVIVAVVIVVVKVIKG